MAKKDIMNMSKEEVAKLEQELKEEEVKKAKVTKPKTKEVDKDEKAYVVLPSAYQRWLGPVYAFSLNGKTFALRVDGTKNEIDAKYKDWVDDKIARVLGSVQREDKIEQL